MTPEQKTFTKAEVTHLLGVQPYIIDLWEKHFGITPTLTDDKPFYGAPDLTKLQLIKELLYEKGFTIDTAKQYLKKHPLLQETDIIAAAPLIFKSPKEPKKKNSTLTRELRLMQKQLIKLRELLS